MGFTPYYLEKKKPEDEYIYGGYTPSKKEDYSKAMSIDPSVYDYSMLNMPEDYSKAMSIDPSQKKKVDAPIDMIQPAPADSTGIADQNKMYMAYAAAKGGGVGGMMMASGDPLLMGTGAVLEVAENAKKKHESYQAAQRQLEVNRQEAQERAYSSLTNIMKGLNVRNI